MYQVDDKDRVGELHDVPQSSVGAPHPFVLSDGRKGCTSILLAEYTRRLGWYDRQDY